MTKTVLLEATGRVHSYLKLMAQNPPMRYHLVLNYPGQNIHANLYSSFIQSDFVFYYKASKIINRIMPLHLTKSYIDGALQRSIDGIELTYSFGHIVSRINPWILEIESPHQLWRI